MARTSTRTVGAAAEDLAFDYLRERGLTLVQRNFQCRLGELDLIMRHGECLVIVEVRFRSVKSLVPARLTIDYRKQQKLIRTTALFLAWNKRFANYPLRFDVLGIDANAQGEISFDWIRDAFRPADSSL